MRRTQFRPRAVSDTTARSRRAGRHTKQPADGTGSRKLRSRVLIAGAVIVVAVVAWVGVQLLRPVPPMTLAVSVTTMRVLPGPAPRPDWPGQAEAAVGLPGTGLLGTHGGSQPVPIASLAKIMTAYLVLSGHPLSAGASGPAITVTAADASAYASDQRPPLTSPSLVAQDIEQSLRVGWPQLPGRQGAARGKPREGQVGPYGAR